MKNLIKVYSIFSDKEYNVSINKIYFIKITRDKCDIMLKNNCISNVKFDEIKNHLTHNFAYIYDFETKSNYYVNSDYVTSQKKSIFYSLTFDNNMQLNAITPFDNNKIAKLIKNTKKAQEKIAKENKLNNNM